MINSTNAARPIDELKKLARELKGAGATHVIHGSSKRLTGTSNHL